MSRILVIGYGNTLREDDGIGPRPAELLEERLCDSDDVRILTVHQLLPEHAAEIAESEYVIFIDASETGEPGDISGVDVSLSPSTLPMTHAPSPGLLLSMARDHFGARPRATLFTLTGSSFGFREGLSETVTSQIHQFIDEIFKFIQSQEKVGVPELQ
ncbi:MAG: hydrogenase maturation protease [Candidatus Marinimicrobia bacterium]|nr:hydrogenase maturation protease [Candidatus Neomarinimicrobiota bacterium]